MRYLNHSPAMSNNPSVRARLVDHVTGCVQKVNNSPAIPHVAAVSTYTPLAAATSHTHSAPSATPHASLPGSSGSLSSFYASQKISHRGIRSSLLGLFLKFRHQLLIHWQLCVTSRLQDELHDEFIYCTIAIQFTVQ